MMLQYYQHIDDNVINIHISLVGFPLIKALPPTTDHTDHT